MKFYKDAALFLKYVIDSDTGVGTTLPKGWEILDNSHNMNIQEDWRWGDSSTWGSWGYHGMAFINRETKQIYIASKGTDLKYMPAPSLVDIITTIGAPLVLNNYVEGLKLYMALVAFVGTEVIRKTYDHCFELTNLSLDLINNIQILLSVPPQQSYVGYRFAERILQKIDNPQDYEIITTGHSLGGVISNLMHLQFALKGYTSHSITFDSLGSETVLNSYLRYNNEEFNLEYLNITGFYAPPNIINSLLSETGDIYKMEMGDIGIKGHYFETIYNYLGEDDPKFTQVQYSKIYTRDEGSNSSFPGDWSELTLIEDYCAEILNCTPIAS